METLAQDLSTMVRTPLHDSHVAEMRKIGAIRTYDAGETLLQAGSEQDAFHYVIDGAVVAIDPRTGGHYGNGHLGPTQFFGEISFLYGGRAMLGGQCLEPSTILSVDRADMLALMSRIPEMSDIIITVFAARRRRLLESGEASLTLIGAEEDRTIRQIAAFAGAYNGVFVDYRGLTADDRLAFTLVIDELGATLNARGLQFGVVVPAAQNASGAWDTGAYDWRSLGTAADYLQVNLDRVDPAMFAPGEDRLVEAMLRWGVGEVSRYKLLVGLTTRSQLQASGGYTPVGYEEALAPLGNVQISGELTAEGNIIPGAPFTAAYSIAR